MTQSQISDSKPGVGPGSRWEWALLALILCVAVALRLWRLHDVPPGLTHDEASNGHDAAAVLRGVRPIYFTVGYGHEPLYPYSVAAVMSVLGTTDTALRLTTVGWGLALILLSYGFARRLFGSLPALLTAAWMATSFWCVMTSRVGLRAITLAVTFAASASCFWLACPVPAGRSALPRRRWLWWALSGAFLGASIYTYMASRAMPAVYLLFLAYLLVLRLCGVRLPYLRGQWMGIAALLLTAAIVAAPLVHFLVTHPGAEQRIGQLATPLQQATQGDLSGLWRRVSRSLPMLTFEGDPLWLYNIPGRPLLDAVSGALFYAGILVCLWHWRDPRYTFLLLWLVVGVSPALATGPDATVLRSIAAQPAVFIVAALALATIVRFLSERAGRWGQILGIGTSVVLMAGVGLRTIHDYFHVWGEHRDVRVLYHHALVQEARYLDAQPEGGAVAFSSIYPGRFHDSYTVELTLRRDDLAVRWFDGRFALIFPAEGEARVIVPTIAPLDAALEPILREHASHVHTVDLRPDDLTPRFDVYRFDAAGALAALLPSMTDNSAHWCPSDDFPADEPQAAYEPLALPVDVGDVVELVGYDLRTPTIGPGGEVELLTLWQVRAPFAPEAVIFAHLLDHGGQVVGQVDRLDVPSWHWRPGDAFVQVHRFQIGAQATPNLYHLEVGIYTREDMARLPVLVDGAAVDDRVLLSPVEVVGQ
jgi:4-amino-4-deoxy-L-arabinose transferase-like glycosyltransferase